MVAKKKTAKKAAKKPAKKAAVKASKVVKSKVKAGKKTSAKKPAKKAASKKAAPKQVAVQPVTDTTGVVTMKSVDDPGVASQGDPASVKPSLDKDTGVITMVPQT